MAMESVPHDESVEIHHGPMDRVTQILFSETALYTRVREHLYRNYAYLPGDPSQPSDLNVLAMELDALELKEGDTLVETATGGGEFAELAARSGHSGKIIATDISGKTFQGTADILRREEFENVTFRQADARDLRFLRDSSVQKMVCNNGYHHMDEPHLALAEAGRVLEEGGLLAIWGRGDFNLPRQRQFVEKGAQELGYDVPKWHYLNFDVEEVDDLIESYGFEIIPYAPFDELCEPGIKSLVRPMLIPRAESKFYTRSVMSFLYAAIAEQEGRRPRKKINDALSDYIKDYVEVIFLDETENGAGFRDTAQDRLIMARQLG